MIPFSYAPPPARRRFVSQSEAPLRPVSAPLDALGRCWKEAFNGAVERAGIKDFHFHDLRHCFGTWLAMNDTNFKAQMELMRHKDPNMTSATVISRSSTSAKP
jgi:integrase